MKKLFVLGDSISIHYGPYLKKYLSGKMEYSRKGEASETGDLNQVSDANGGDSGDVLDYLQKTAEMEYDILLLNCGLHDIKVTDGRQVELEQYRSNLEKILRLVDSRGKQVIWVTTTPVDDEQHHRCMKKFARFHADVRLYNQVAEEIMQKHQIPMIDLYHFTKQLGEGVYVDHVHYIDSVRQLQAAYIAGALLRR